MSVEDKDETAGFITESNAEQEPVTPEPSAEESEEQANSEDETSEAGNEPESQESNNNSEEGEGEADKDSGEDASDKGQSKKKTGVKKRISELVKQREEAKRENEELQRKIEELSTKKDSSSSEPKENDFDTYDEYLDALDEYDKSSKEDQGKPEKAESKKEGEQKDLTSSQKTAVALLQERLADSEKPDDFEQVGLAPDVKITPEMVEILAECEDPAKVIYHLGKNKDLAGKIAGGSIAQQAREIAKLDLSVSKPPQKPVKTTNAPDPISPVNGSDSQKKNLSEMSFSEFEAHDRAKNSGKKSTW